MNRISGRIYYKTDRQNNQDYTFSSNHVALGYADDDDSKSVN